ncbi:PEP-CTERM sorting domain-containing protein [Thalassotalea sp. HSM 43]|uniref:PEP-CTERM sorting domain-containing protein n=1 Tax=Thalassotalea sp. HSM 43 TaxID=2552945 RepID=UPI0010816C6F|nr:PEP-CTERM sorting domain-containing protein [Thalassotalea sp. HSM 43]QBY03102.1 PEP-CTERM sorting domain-containing protein [Thalassotalea sp. HSM 43]
MCKQLGSMVFLISLLISSNAYSALISIDSCEGDVVDCVIVDDPSGETSQTFDTGVFIAWDEVQSYTLTEDLFVNEVFDIDADYIEMADGGGYFIKAGTVISSHYAQWDVLGTSFGAVEASLVFDSDVVAFITSSQALMDSDGSIGLIDVDYLDFELRGLEGESRGDFNSFLGDQVDLRWAVDVGADSARFITLSSGGTEPPEVPEPTSLLLMLSALGIGAFRRRIL